MRVPSDINKKEKLPIVKPRRTDLRENKELYEKLLEARVVQKELVYIIGLSPRIASKNV